MPGTPTSFATQPSKHFIAIPLDDEEQRICGLDRVQVELCFSGTADRVAVHLVDDVAFEQTALRCGTSPLREEPEPHKLNQGRYTTPTGAVRARRVR